MLACRSLRALVARLGLVASLPLAAGGALAQDHYDFAGTRIPAFMLLDGCPNEGACAGPNGSGNPLFVAPTIATSWGAAGAAGAFVDGWDVTKGAKTDAANAATDATPASAMSVWKQISKSVQAAVTALGSPFQAGGSIGNAAFGATQSGVWQMTPTVPAASVLALTPSTIAYAAGQLVASSATAASIVNPSFAMPALGGGIPRLRLSSDDPTATAWAGASLQIDLWDAAPTWTNGDHAAWLPLTGAAHHIASYTCAFPAAAWGDGVATECAISQGNYASNVTGPIYWSAEALTGSGVLAGSKHLSIRPELN
jgi:hypothetical protein